MGQRRVSAFARFGGSSSPRRGSFDATAEEKDGDNVRLIPEAGEGDKWHDENEGGDEEGNSPTGSPKSKNAMMSRKSIVISAEMFTETGGDSEDDE